MGPTLSDGLPRAVSKRRWAKNSLFIPIEVVNRSLGNLFRILVGHIGTWDLKLVTAEFAYNTPVNKTTAKSPHKIVYGFRPKQPVDLIPMSGHIRASTSASSFASHVHDLHKKVMDKIAQSNTNYKLQAYVRKRLKTFSVGDHVMVQIRLERFPLE